MLGVAQFLFHFCDFVFCVAVLSMLYEIRLEFGPLQLLASVVNTV